MIELPNPFTSALASETMAETATARDLTDPPVAVAEVFESSTSRGGPGTPAVDMEPHTAAGATDPFNDEPLPLFLTQEFPAFERELTAMLQVIFGVPV